MVIEITYKITVLYTVYSGRQKNRPGQKKNARLFSCILPLVGIGIRKTNAGICHLSPVP
jgi:hypothetical protein